MSDTEVMNETDEVLKLLSAEELAAKADKWWEIKNKRLAADKVAKALKTEESALEAMLIDQMRRSKISAIGGTTVRLSMDAPTDEPMVENWPVFWEYIKTENDFSLLEKRPGRAAIKERWEKGKSIPGVGRFPVYKLSKSGVK